MFFSMMVSMVAVAEQDASGEAAHSGVPVTQDLAALGVESRQGTVPILLMFAAEDCSYCERLESEVLAPLRLSGVDPTKVIVRKVMLEEYESISDFAGNKRDADDYAAEHGVQVVPTVVLVDAKGNELVPNLVGYQATGFYNAYLDEAIKVSKMLLGQR